MNNNIVLVVGKPSSGKSTSLRNLDNDKTAYINADNKPLPFKNKFYKDIRLTNIDHLLSGLKKLEEDENVENIVIDTLNYVMDMYEAQKVVTAVNTQSAWGDYAQFYNKLIYTLKTSKKNIIVFSHTKDIYNESELVMEQRVPVKGAVGQRGVEADFTIIVGAKKVKIGDLKNQESDLLNIKPREEANGFKHCFQTYVTKETMNEKMRSPMDLWDEEKELFIDNDVNLLMNKINEYYK